MRKRKLRTANGDLKKTRVTKCDVKKNARGAEKYISGRKRLKKFFAIFRYIC